jgi:uncharacterized protein (TIGR02646 family)
MIRIDRARHDEHGVPIRPPKSWFELAKTWTDNALREHKAHEANGNVYGHNAVRAALEALCDQKCAYCESPAPASGPWDVEHFRPKGSVSESTVHPGYYWLLTYTWENLLLSCGACNKKLSDKPTWTDPTTGPAAGKLDRFPLQDEHQRAMDPTFDLSLEQPLLIDPTRLDPEDHITFDLIGEAVAHQGSAEGEKSIELYNLNRRRLKAQRLVQIRTVLRLIDTLVQHNGLSVPDAVDTVTTGMSLSELAYAGTTRAIRRDPASFGLVF